MTERKGAEGKGAKYAKPVIRTYRVYERRSLACGKVGGGSLQCRGNPKSS